MAKMYCCGFLLANMVYVTLLAGGAAATERRKLDMDGKISHGTVHVFIFFDVLDQ